MVGGAVIGGVDVVVGGGGVVTGVLVGGVVVGGVETGPLVVGGVVVGGVVSGESAIVVLVVSPVGAAMPPLPVSPVWVPPKTSLPGSADAVMAGGGGR